MKQDRQRKYPLSRKYYDTFLNRMNDRSSRVKNETFSEIQIIINTGEYNFGDDDDDDDDEFANEYTQEE